MPNAPRENEHIHKKCNLMSSPKRLDLVVSGWRIPVCVVGLFLLSSVAHKEPQKKLTAELYGMISHERKKFSFFWGHACGYANVSKGGICFLPRAPYSLADQTEPMPNMMAQWIASCKKWWRKKLDAQKCIPRLSDDRIYEGCALKVNTFRFWRSIMRDAYLGIS